MRDCLFCKIIRKEISAEIIYEDRDVVAFLDIKPCNPGHALVVPKTHFNDLLSASDEALRSVVSVLPRIAQALMKGLDYSAFNVMVNNGVEAGQVISHLHFHVIPRKDGDGHKPWTQVEYAAGEMANVAQKIRRELVE